MHDILIARPKEKSFEKIVDETEIAYEYKALFENSEHVRIFSHRDRPVNHFKRKVQYWITEIEDV